MCILTSFQRRSWLIRSQLAMYTIKINMCTSICQERNWSVPRGAESNSFLHKPGRSFWLTALSATLVGNERGWQLLKLTPTPPADTQSLLLMQYNLFILLRPLFQFGCQDCVWASSHKKMSQSHPRALATRVVCVLVILPGVTEINDPIATKNLST